MTAQTPQSAQSSLARTLSGFWPRWMAAFLVFPIGGSAALLAGGMTDPPRAFAGGLIAGLIYGTGTYLAAHSTTRLGWQWIAASALGMGVGNAAGVALFGAGIESTEITQRAIVTGVVLGAAQAFSLRQQGSRAALWLPVIAMSYPIAWTVTRGVIGTSVQNNFHVFGASGALIYQLLTGLALRWRIQR